MTAAADAPKPPVLRGARSPRLCPPSLPLHRCRSLCYCRCLVWGRAVLAQTSDRPTPLPPCAHCRSCMWQSARIATQTQMSLLQQIIAHMQCHNQTHSIQDPGLSMSMQSALIILPVPVPPQPVGRCSAAMQACETMRSPRALLSWQLGPQVIRELMRPSDAAQGCTSVRKRPGHLRFIKWPKQYHLNPASICPAPVWAVVPFVSFEPAEHTRPALEQWVRTTLG